MGAQMGKTAMGPTWANPLGALEGFLWESPLWACPQQAHMGPQRVCPCPHCPTENPHLPTVGPHWHVCWVIDFKNIPVFIHVKIYCTYVKNAYNSS